MTGCAVREGGELRAVRVGPADGVARKLDDGDLHTEADAEIGTPFLARVLRGEDHALDAAVAEAAGHQHARAAAENGGDILRRQRFESTHWIVTCASQAVPAWKSDSTTLR